MHINRIVLPFAFLTLVSCGSAEKTPQPPSPEATQPPSPEATQPSTTPPTSDLGAEVLETIDAGTYTYVKLETDGRQDWYAVPQCEVEVGERVTVSPGAMEMRDFESKTLARKFDLIYFAQGLQRVGASATAPDAARVAAAHGLTAKDAPAATAVEKAEGGMTVAEVWAAGAAGAGKEVTLRGRVVKWNPGILGTNWLHVRDGSGSEGSNDITVTTAGEAKVGDIVLVKGKISADRDFGAGYVYAVMIEDAVIVIE